MSKQRKPDSSPPSLGPGNEARGCVARISIAFIQTLITSVSSYMRLAPINAHMDDTVHILLQPAMAANKKSRIRPPTFNNGILAVGIACA